MTNTLIEHLEGLVTQYQGSNSRNSVRVGKALGRISNIILECRGDAKKKHLIQDLKYIQENIDEIEL